MTLRSRRMLAALPAALVLVGGALAMTAGSAAAAPCSGGSCNAQDPYSLGCTAASSITKTYTSGSKVATFVNEYSKLCNANWVFAYENTAAQNAGWQLNIGISTHDTHGVYWFMCSPYPAEFSIGGGISEQCVDNYGGANGWPMWTDMVDGTNKSFGSMNVYDSSGNLITTVENDQ